MSTKDISSTQLYAHESRIRGQVVLITGLDIQKDGVVTEIASELAKRGAKVIVGGCNAPPSFDDPSSPEGGPVFEICDVNDWDSQVSLFQLTESKFGGVDIVIACSDERELGDFTTIPVDENGRPKQPNVDTLQTNLISVIYTTRLALHYLNKSPNPSSLKRIVFRGAMHSLAGLDSPLYGAAKHGVLGFMRALRDDIELGGIHVSAVAPWSASQEKDLRPQASLVAGAIFFAATDTDPEAKGAIYSFLDDPNGALADPNQPGIVRRTAYLPFTEGTNGLLIKRAERLTNFGQNVKKKGIFLALAGTLPVQLTVLGVLGYVASKVVLDRD
ncbi:NAD(P)-binding protein [Rickenella mellea]|uniref:NAD(P)-binding protein n=1 Tax=Rickenella mellea TaxID=50990 RepID=A0A4Y7PIM2_9AGAM|nr:NAD(P)-binding protein [Rickenella mellea]